jgi:hypothetical protein
MNAVDVNAVGWIVTRDLWVETARRALDLPPRFDDVALERLGRAWLCLDSSVRDDQQAMPAATWLLCPRHAPLSARSEQAMAVFVDELVAVCPALYAHRALANRCLGACGRLIASVLCATLAACFATPAMPMSSLASLSFFVFGCWSLATALQLSIAFRIAARRDKVSTDTPIRRRRQGRT